MDPELIVLTLIKLAIDLVGAERAKALLSQEAINRANAEADAVETARGLR